MATQSTYSEALDPGRPGALADLGHNVLISRTIEAGGDDVAFGKPVTQGASDYEARLITTGDTAVLGIAVRDRASPSDVFKAGESARILTEGVIWVTAAVAVDAGDPVTVVLASATFSNTGGVAITGARYEESGDAGALVPIRL